MSSSTDDFYEDSRRNIAVLLVFWITYILAYLVMAWTIVNTRSGAPLSRKRRSNLSRLMLLGAPTRRPRSLPPVSSGVRHFRSTSLRGITESEGENRERTEFSDTDAFSPSGDEFPASPASPESLLSRHLLSSFVPEYTTAVVGLAVVMQGVLIMPVSMLVIIIAKDMTDKRLQWMVFRALEQWWRWVWNAALILIFGALPMSAAWLEGRGRRDAPVLKRFSIIGAKLFGLITRWGLVKPVLAVCAVITLYLLASLLGIFHPIELSEWIIILNSFCMTISSVLSLICIPLGISTIFRYVIELTVAPTNYQEISSQIQDLNEQISNIEATLSPPSGTLVRTASMPTELTPVSSKSLRSKLAELYSRSADLKSQVPLRRRSRWKNFKAMLMISMMALSLAYVIYVEIRTFLQFFVSNVLWYLPGLQLVDRLLYRLALMFNLVYVRDTKEEVASFSSSLLISSWVIVLLMVFLFFGLRRLARRRFKVVYKISPNFPPRRTLDRFLVILAICLFSTVLSVPLLCISGATDYLDVQIAEEMRPNSYTSPLVNLYPLPLKQIIDILNRTIVLRFPLLVWLIITYRLLLIISIIGVGIKSIRKVSFFGSCPL